MHQAQKKMRVIAMIPARFEAVRFPGKLLKDLGGKAVVVRTYEATKKNRPVRRSIRGYGQS